MKASTWILCDVERDCVLGSSSLETHSESQDNPRKEALRAESRWTRKTVRGFLPRAARGGPGTRVELGSYSS